MSRRNWLSNVAAIGCLIAATIFVSPALGQTEQQRQADINAKAQQHQQAAAPGPTTEKENLTPEEFQNPCGLTEKAYVADLCEQRRMAEAAIRQVDWVRAQFWATVVEIILLIGVIGVSGWAAWEAGGSAIAAQKSAEAAEAAVNVASDTAKRQLRAYVTLNDAIVEWLSPQQFAVVISVINSGQTPAIGLRYASRVAVGGKPDHFEEMSKIEDNASTIDLGAGTDIKLRIPNPDPLPEDIVTAAKERRVPLYVWGEIRYRDVFGKTRRTHYRMELAESGDKLRMCSSGNEST